MTLTKIYAPGGSDKSGLTYLGPNPQNFVKGVAEVDLSTYSDGAIDYMRRNGYGIGEPAPTRQEPEPPPPPLTPLELEAHQAAEAADALEDAEGFAVPVLVGPPLRDAAVDGFAPGELHTIVGEGDPQSGDVRSIVVGSREWAALVQKQRAEAAQAAAQPPKTAGGA